MKIEFSRIAALFLLASLWIQPVDASSKDEALCYGVTRVENTFATIFDMAKEKNNYGSVVKSMFHLSPNYDAYDRYGLYQASGICRTMTLGMIYSWASEIDIYDSHGNTIGLISGHVICSEPAKFSFYDDQEKCICIATLDKDSKCFVLADPENSSLVLARITRNYNIDTNDLWDVTFYHPQRLPLRFLNIFAAFVCDSQNDFEFDF